jgi:hypothetical protein
MRMRMRIEILLAVISAVLSLATLVFPTWIEAVTGFEPDAGGGELEWVVALGFGFLAVVLALLARRDRRGLARATA